MAQLKFLGFPPSSPVDMTVTQSGISRSGSIPAWEVTASVDIAIEAPATPFEGEQIWLRAENYSGLAAATYSASDTGYEYLHEHHEYFHVWTVNGSPITAPTAPENMPTEWNNPNKLYGSEVCVCLPAGTHTIGLRVVDKNGVTAEATSSTIAVITEDAAFPTTKTKVIALDGDFTGAPAGASQYTTLASAYATLNGSTEDVRFLFKRGEDYTGADIRLLNGSRYARCIGSWGTGAKPILTDIQIYMKGSFPLQDGVMVRDLDLRSGYDSTVERGKITTNPLVDLDEIVPIGSGADNTFLTFSGLTLSKSGRLMALQNPNTSQSQYGRVCINDCIFTDWQDYGLYYDMEASKIAITGSRIQQHVDALSGQPRQATALGSIGNNHGGAPLGNWHGPYRIARAAVFYKSRNDIFSRTGWSGNDQPAGRIFVNNAVGNEKGTVERNVMEGGYQVINLLVANFGETPSAQPMNLVIERNLLISSDANNEGMISSWRSGVTIRGNYLYTPNNEATGPGDGNAISFADSTADNGGGNAAILADAPIQIYNNTVLYEKTAANEASTGRDTILNIDNFYNTFVQNFNLIHQPASGNAITAPNVSQLVDFSGVTTRSKGERDNYIIYRFQISDYAPGDIPNGGTISVPYSVFGRDLSRGGFVSPNTTDQAYWQASEAAGNTRHEIFVRTQGTYGYAEHGEISVNFTATDVVITNNTGVSWTASYVLCVHLDRTTLIPGFDPDRDSSGLSVPILKTTLTPPEAISGDIHMSGDLFGDNELATALRRGAVAHNS